MRPGESSSCNFWCETRTGAYRWGAQRESLSMNRRGKVYFRDQFAGTIEQKDGEYIFTYDSNYIAREDAKPISFTLPLRKEPYKQKTMIPFFDGLIPEGWLLDIATKNWKIDRRDRMGLLLTVCPDCVGAVHVINEDGQTNE